MRILYLDWPCFGKADILHTLTQKHEVISFFHEDYQERRSAAFDCFFDEFLGNTCYDCCFSYNYFPIVSESCKRHNLKYISAVYDSPYVMLYSYTLINPNNYVFLFDKYDYLTFRNSGIETVYYSPLPVNGDRISQLLTEEYDHDRFSSEVSFVGALYNEDHNLFDRLKGITSYTEGYLKAIMDAQLKVQGYNFVEEVLTPDIVADLQKAVPYTPIPTGTETPEYIYSNYFINRKLTALERYCLLKEAALHCKDLKLYTLNPDAHIPGVRNMGRVDYYSEMPYVFANSRINLNITLRSIQSGIPLRAMDIMGAGGFLLSNFQADFLDYFIPGEDFVYYETKEDLMSKIEYYLSHEKERKEIAQNGHKKVKTNHSFEKFFTHIFETIF